MVCSYVFWVAVAFAIFALVASVAFIVGGFHERARFVFRKRR